MCVCVCVHLTAIMIANSTKVCGFRCPPPTNPLPVPLTGAAIALDGASVMSADTFKAESVHVIAHS